MTAEKCRKYSTEICWEVHFGAIRFTVCQNKVVMGGVCTKNGDVTTSEYRSRTSRATANGGTFQDRELLPTAVPSTTGSRLPRASRDERNAGTNFSHHRHESFYKNFVAPERPSRVSCDERMPSKVNEKKTYVQTNASLQISNRSSATSRASSGEICELALDNRSSYLPNNL